MKIFHVKLNIPKLLSFFILFITLVFVLLAIVNLGKEIMTANQIVITNTNYTNILTEAYDDIDSFVGKHITVTGYVFRLEDFGSNEFVIARDMLVDNHHSQVVGFLCKYNQISEYETNSWVKITGIIEKGNYFGEIPIIRIKSIKKVTTPNEIFVTPPLGFGDGA